MTRRFASLFSRSGRNTGALVKALIWLFCLLLIAGTWAFVVQQSRFERQQAIDEALAQNVNRVIAFEQYVRRTLEVAAIATRYVANRFERGEAGPEFLGTAERPAMMRGNFARPDGTFLGVAVADAAGDVVASSRRGAGRMNVADNEAFRVHVARDSGGLFVSRPFRAPSLGRDVILLTRRLNNPDGSFAGVVSLIIAPEQFTGFYREARIGPQDVMSLIGLDGITRARRTGPVTSSGEDLRGGLVMRQQARDPNGTYVGPSVLDGQIRYFSHRRLPDYPLFATYGVLESEVLALPRRRARVLLATAALLTVVTVGFALLLTVLVNRGQRGAAEIARTHAQLEEAQRIARMGDWRIDLKTNAIEWSPSMYALFERDPLQPPPSIAEYRTFLSPEGKRVTDEAAKRILAEGEKTEYEVLLHLPNGTEAWQHIVAIPLRGGDGKICGMRGTAQDVTARKRIERLEQRVTHLARIQAMNAMATTLAHELNQPLAAAANYLVGTRRRLDAAPGDRPGIEEGMAAAEQQIHFAGDIIRRVREMVANQPKTLSDFPLSAVIDDAVVLIAGAAGRPGPEIARRLDPGASHVYADRVQVQQVIINLLRNALQATAGVSDPRIVVAAQAAEKDMVMLSVSDNGPGFSQPRAERFSPFAGVSGAGMGLGLSISRTIVEGNGGRIWTEDREEGGARVCFTLPAARAGPGRTQREAKIGAAV